MIDIFRVINVRQYGGGREEWSQSMYTETRSGCIRHKKNTRVEGCVGGVERYLRIGRAKERVTRGGGRSG